MQTLSQNMEFVTLVLLAIGLCFDTFAVSVTTGLILNSITFFNATKIALTFAFFQGAMPVVGWVVGSRVRTIAADYDHWLAFVLLLIIGIKMIVESFKKEEKRQLNPLQPRVMAGLGLATSIDALVVGISLAFFETRILTAGFIIGAVTFIASMLGILFGKKTGERFGRKMEIFGGIILILIGVKILSEHLFGMSLL